MKISFMVGHHQQGKCGVGDYTFHLADALRQVGAEVDVIRDSELKLGRLPKLWRLVRSGKPDILHVQYPSLGTRYKLGPQGIATTMPGVVTLHEASHSHLLRKLSLYPFSLRAKHVIFTSEVERRFALRWAPWITERSSIIPIGSNIVTQYVAGGGKIEEIIYFGLITPNKGLEDVLNLAALMKADCPHLSIRIIGSYRAEHARYAESLHLRSLDLPVKWEHDLDESAVARRLVASSIAYLPFPDGASERRGSLKAVLAASMAVVTTCGFDTPNELAGIVRFCSGPSEALVVIRDMVANPALARDLGTKAHEYAETFSWRTIALRHMEIYERLSAHEFCRSEGRSGFRDSFVASNQSPSLYSRLRRRAAIDESNGERNHE